MKEEIIDYIQKNRVSSTEVADALGKSGVIHGMKSNIEGNFVTGEVFYCFGYNNSNYSIHEQIKDAPEDKVIFVDLFNCDNQAAFGDLVSKFFILYKRSRALVVNGLLRDAHNLKKHKYPIWCKGFTPLGCFNKKQPLPDDIAEMAKERKEKFHGGILTCDDSGCTLIEKRQFTDDFLNRLHFIEMQEDAWYYCIDTLKWNTFDTVCLKNYLKDDSALPEQLRKQLGIIDLEKGK